MKIAKIEDAKRVLEPIISKTPDVYKRQMQDNGVIIGYLGIDNYTCHKEHPGFLRMLSYYLSNELAKMKLQKKQLYMHYHDYLSGALNRASYQQYRQELMEERLISLGVVSLDINGLRDINCLLYTSKADS